MNSNRPSSKRLTIGFLIDHTDSQYQFGILQGISDYAEHRDINLVCFEGGLLKSMAHFKDERNILYALADSRRLDGIIVLTDSVAARLDDKALFQFRESFQPLPVVFIGRGHPRVPSVAIDSFTGMKEMVSHLIEKHHYRSFGFIRGLSGSYHAEVRYNAFAEALAEHDIPIDNDLVYDGDFLEVSGRLAVRSMLDVHKKIPEVIVACNDEMAISAIHELLRRGIRVPRKVAVVGVDDIPKCATTAPPLTSVRQPLLREGWTAMSLMADMLDGKSASQASGKVTPNTITLDSRLIVRESCGCSIGRTSATSSSYVPRPSFLDDDSDKRRERYISQIQSVLRGVSFDQNWQKETELAPAMLVAYGDAIHTGNKEVFLDLWRDFLNVNFHLEADEVIINGILQTLRRYVNVRSLHESAFLSENAMFWTATSMLEKRALQALRKSLNTSMREEWVLNQLRDQLDISFDRTQILDILHRNLVELGIRSAYISMFDRNGNPGSAHMILAYSGESRHPLPEEGLSFPANLLIPDVFFDDHDRFSFMAEALYYGDQQIGFLILDMSRHINSVHAGIRRIVSNIFRSIDLVNKIQHQKTELVDSLGLLKETLEGITKTLSVTVGNRDPYTAGHQRRVAELSLAIGRELQLSDGQLEEIRVAALLHDIGKLYTPAEILNKPGALKPIEFELIKDHAEEGYNTLKNIEFPWPVAEVVYQHHERCDGSGYPRGLVRDQILLSARILSVADVVEAITSRRPYRSALSMDAAVEEITRFRGKRYDADVVDAAMRLLESGVFQPNGEK